MELLTYRSLYRAPMQVKNILNLMNFQICRPAVTDPHKVVTTQDCSPTLYEYLLKYSDLHLEYLWRTSCYMYPPQNGQY